MTLDSFSLFWPVGTKELCEDGGHLMKDFADDQGLGFFRSGPVCQEPVQGQLDLLLRKGRKKLMAMLSK